MNIPVNQNTLLRYLIGSKHLAVIQASKYRIGVLIRHLHKRYFDDNGRIHTHTKFHEQDMLPLMGLHKIIISLGCIVPALGLDKGIVCTEIHTHRFSADGTILYHIGWDTHIPLLFKHRPDSFFVVIGLVVARFTALPQAVIALCVEKPLFVKACLLELVINIRGDNEKILVLH